MPPGSLGRSILSADACAIPSLCLARRAAWLMGWAWGLLPHRAHCPTSPSLIPWDREGNIHEQCDVLRAQEGKQPHLAGFCLIFAAILPRSCHRSRVLMEGTKAGWEQPGSLDCWWFVPGAACSSLGLRQSQGNQWLGLHHVVVLRHLLHPSSSLGWSFVR